MFLQDKNSLFKDQKDIRPKIEDIVIEHLKEDFRKSIHEFVSYLKENKMTTQWVSVNSWKILHKSKDLAFFKIYEGSWYIDPVVDFKDKNFETFAKKENIDKVILNNIELCTNQSG